MPAVRRRESGLTTIDVLIALSVVLLILAVGVPASGRIKDDARVERVVSLADRLERACRAHRRDTGLTAVEFSPSGRGEAYSRPRYHTLSMSQRTEGWRGPYIDRPLSLADNPFGGAVYLQNDLSAAPASGFRLAGPDGPLTEGPGQFLVLYGVPRDLARAVDRRLDRGALEDEDWTVNGRVEWVDAGGGGLVIHLLGPEKE